MIEYINMGLKFITIQNSFVFQADNIERDEGGTVNFYNTELSLFMKEFFQVFEKNEFKEDNYMQIQLEFYISYTDVIKTKFEEFFKKYKQSYPRLNALKKCLSSIKENEYICILPTWIKVDTITIINILEELHKLNGVEFEKTEEPFINLFSKHYNMDILGISQLKIGHKNKNDRICRWCKRSVDSNPPASFKKVAHAISEALGNKNLILLDECDDCNEKFGKTIEKSLITSLSFFNTFWGVVGKDGVPKIKSKDIVIENIGNNKSQIIVSKEEMLKLKDGLPSSISYLYGKLIKQDIYKALCKFALSALTDEQLLGKFDWTIQWITSNLYVKKTPVVKQIISDLHAMQNPVIQIFTRKSNETDLPQMFAMFYYNNLVYSYIVPTSETELNKFCNECNFNKFWQELPYSKVQEWENVDFSDSIEKNVQMILNFNKKDTNNS